MGFSTTHRSVSSALGTILIVGIVLLASGLLLTGSSLGDGAQNEHEQADIEKTLTTFDQEIESAVTAEEDRATISLSMESGTSWTSYYLEQDAGSISVSVGGSTVYEGSLGKIHTEHEGIDTVYQSGGIWKNNSQSNTLIQSPGLKYSDIDDPTYYFNIIQVSGGPEISEDPSASIQNTNALYNDRFVSKSETVEIVIQSDSPLVWKQILLDEYALDESQVSMNPSTGEVTAEFGSGEEIYFHLSRSVIDLS